MVVFVRISLKVCDEKMSYKLADNMEMPPIDELPALTGLVWEKRPLSWDI